MGLVRKTSVAFAAVICTILFAASAAMAQDQGVSVGTPLADLAERYSSAGVPQNEIATSSFKLGEEYIILTFEPIDTGEEVKDLMESICSEDDSICASVQASVQVSDMNMLERLLAAELAIMSDRLEVQIAISSLQRHQALLLAAQAANALAASRAEGAFAAATATNDIGDEVGRRVDAGLLEAAEAKIDDLEVQAADADQRLQARIADLTNDARIGRLVCADGIPETDPTLCDELTFAQ